MRVVLVLLLFQFISPALFSLASQNLSAEQMKPVTVHVEHSSVLLPIFLKEKEEKELKDGFLNYFIAPQLIDFTDHSLVLTELHSLKSNSVPYQQHYDVQPPLFTLFCAYII